MFVDEGLIDIGRVSRLIGIQAVSVWEKLTDVIMGQRQRDLNPQHLWFI